MMLRTLQRRCAAAAAAEAAKPKILITGSLGQVGCAQLEHLREKYGKANVIASDIVMPTSHFRDGPFEYADVTNYSTLATLSVERGVEWIVHNSSMQSLAAEANPGGAMDVHITGIRNVLELARNMDIRLFVPSSMAVFSPESGLDNTPDMVPNRPKTVYGVTKCFTENIGVYYHKKYGIDFRCLRYPGVVSTLTEGKSPIIAKYRETTDDYPTMALHAYKKGEVYTCGVDVAKRLPYIFIDDALEASAALMAADASQLSRRVYNLQGMSFAPYEFEAEVRKHLPDFRMRYDHSKADTIAQTWPNSLDDSAFRKDLKWQPKYDLEGMVKTLLQRLSLI